jgi:hypothetical protein
MVQIEKVAKIREAWAQKGKPRCTHESYDKEYHLGSDTGDYACMNCGISWPRSADKPPPEPRDAAE